MLVGIDIDDVKVDFYRAFIKYYNEQHGTSISYEELTDFQIHHVLKTDRETVKKALDTFYQSKEFREIEPFPDAKKTIPIIAKQHRLVVISSRPEHIHDHTRAWLEYHFPGCFMDVHFSTKTGKRKANICQDLGVDVFIEDNIDYAKEVADNGIRVLLFDRPWNQTSLPANITRVQNWTEVQKELNT